MTYPYADEKPNYLGDEKLFDGLTDRQQVQVEAWLRTLPDGKKNWRGGMLRNLKANLIAAARAAPWDDATVLSALFDTWEGRVDAPYIKLD